MKQSCSCFMMQAAIVVMICNVFVAMLSSYLFFLRNSNDMGRDRNMQRVWCAHQRSRASQYESRTSCMILIHITALDLFDPVDNGFAGCPGGAQLSLLFQALPEVAQIAQFQCGVQKACHVLV